MSQKEQERLKDLARGVVLAQGNVFIKEFLREHDIMIGTTKEDFVANLERAIDQGELTLQDFEEWLAKVEGWGHVHIYAYHLPDAVVNAQVWSTPETVREAIDERGLLDYWHAGTSHAFPEELALTRIAYDDRELVMEWHKGVDRRRRDKSKDYEEVIGDDRYEFHAYRVIAQRKVVRLHAHLDSSLLALYIQIPLSDDTHRTAIDDAWATADVLVSKRTVEPFHIARAIQQIDDDQLDEEADDSISPRNVRYTAGDSYAEFGTVRGESYAEVDDIREIRRSVRNVDVRGRTAKIEFVAPGEKGVGRPITVQFHADDRRLWIPAQITEAQARYLLDLIQPYSAST